MIKRNDDGSVYVCLLPWFRLIFRGEVYCGWYNPRLNRIIE